MNIKTCKCKKISLWYKITEKLNSQKKKYYKIYKVFKKHLFMCLNE